MASDLINRNQLLAEIYTEWLLVVPDRPVFICGELQRSERAKILEELMKMVEKQPTVDAVEVVHGWWDDSFDVITQYCTACGRSHNCIYRTPNYCPNCGAKMDGGDKE